MSIALPHILQLEPYKLGEQPPECAQAVKLNQNESPYPPSPKVAEALRRIGEEALRRYPDPECRELRAALAERLGAEPGQLFVGNGSSEIISLIAKAFLGSGGVLAMPDPSFGLYLTAAAACGGRAVPVPTRDDFTVDTDALLAVGAKVIALVNPNAPTGLPLPVSEIDRLAAAHPGLLVVDEAYIDYAEPGTSALPLLDRRPNLLILRTFSKSYALCGARVGYAVGGRPLIEALERARDIYNVNAVSRALALAALSDEAYLRETTAAVRATRDRCAGELRRLGCGVLPSQTNFLLVQPPVRRDQRDASASAASLAASLRAAGIYVRRFADHPRLSDRLRVSIGTDSEMDAFLSHVEQWLANRRD
ncbi:histidinol-phosphate transaminase [Paenibacillus thermoaerophilus]|uniref:Histidinol-phosphate aminotransferase n=1 Tax=Paenibacillus thermoaerophilus TaxID=1215385 RepID=A0ABW2V2L9_9BACL|nr:histidinol-phosphate transaminase [Paenibacillus thermoaerophilus]TMV18197.1 histidinol-phosphate transaminase [Paenibacillus thermoaerophilus]